MLLVMVVCHSNRKAKSNSFPACASSGEVRKRLQLASVHLSAVSSSPFLGSSSQAHLSPAVLSQMSSGRCSPSLHSKPVLSGCLVQPCLAHCLPPTAPHGLSCTTSARVQSFVCAQALWEEVSAFCGDLSVETCFMDIGEWMSEPGFILLWPCA